MFTINDEKEKQLVAIMAEHEGPIATMLVAMAKASGASDESEFIVALLAQASSSSRDKLREQISRIISIDGTTGNPSKAEIAG